MSDVATDTSKIPEADPEIQVLIEGIDEIPEEPPVNDPLAGKTKADLAAELQATRDALQAEQNHSLETSAIRQSLEHLQKVAPAPAPVAPVSEEEYEKAFNEGFYDNPYKKMREFQMQKLGPEIRRVQQGNLQGARNAILLDDDRRETFKQYQAEVDQLIAGLPEESKLFDPDIYKKAHDAVIARHVKDIIADSVKKAVEEATKGKGVTLPTRPTNFAERGTAPRGTTPTRIILTQAEAKTADNKGMTREAYAAYLMRHPELRVARK